MCQIFPYFQSCCPGCENISCYLCYLNWGVHRVHFLLVGDKHEFFLGKSEDSCCVPGPAWQQTVGVWDCSVAEEATGWFRGQGRTYSREFFFPTLKMGGRLMADKVTLHIITLFRKGIKVPWQNFKVEEVRREEGYMVAFKAIYQGKIAHESDTMSRNSCSHPCLPYSRMGTKCNQQIEFMHMEHVSIRYACLIK